MIYPLSEGEYTIGHDKIFVPYNAAGDIATRPAGSLLVEVQPFLVTIGDDVILLDTGLGFSDERGALLIHQTLRRHGFEPGDVTKVLMSHLHKDHAGGMLQQEPSGAAKPAFENAAYFIYRAEADYALEVGRPSYHPEDFEPLLTSGQVVWLDGAGGRIDDRISFKHTGAHCPQHVAYFLEDGQETIFYGGDEAPQVKQMKTKYIAKYDYNGKKAMLLREAWAIEGRQNSWTALFYHDVKCPVARL